MKGQDKHSEMPSGLTAWAEYLAEKSLPLLESTTRYVKELDSRSGKSVDKICEKLLLDPGAVVALLHKVNSLKRGRLSTEITTAENAVMLLGIDKSRRLLERSKVVKLPVTAPALKHYLKTLDLAYHAGYLAHNWAIVRGSMIAKESFVQAFLFHIGEMYMWLYGLSEIVKVRVTAIEKRVPFRVAQHEIMGFDFRELSGEMTKILNMPEIVQICFDNEHKDIPNVRAVSLASAWVSMASHHGLYTHDIRACELEIADLLGYSIDKTTTLLHKTIVAIAREATIYDVMPLARDLPRTDVELNREERSSPSEIPSSTTQPASKSGKLSKNASELDTVNKKRSEDTPATEESERKRTSPNLVNPEENSELLDDRDPGEVLRELAVSLNSGKLKTLSHQNLVSHFVKNMKVALNLDHVMHCETGSKGKHLRAIQFSDKASRKKLEKFFVDLTRDSLIVRLLKKPQSLWLSDNNRDKLWPFLPTVVKGVINTRSFFMMTLVLKNGINCLVYADRAASGHELDNKTYQYFKKLCKLFGDNLELLEL